MIDLEWKQWIQSNKKNLEHVVNFKEKFVENVLSKIPEISPDDVKARAHFVDSKGNNRFINFLISNSNKGYMLAVEVSGIKPLNDGGYDEFEASTERNNEIIKYVGSLLCFTNKSMINDPQSIINEIKDALKKQHSDFLKSQHQKEAELAKREKEFRKVQQEQESYIAMSEALLAKQKKEIELQNAQTQQHHYSSSNQSSKYVPFLLLAITLIGVGYFIFAKFLNGDETSLNNLHTKPSITENESYLSEAKNNQIESIQTNTDTVLSTLALNYVGSVKTVCGKAIQYKRFKKGIYINFDREYPNQTFTVLVWDSTPNIIDKLVTWQSTTLCVNGKISDYKGRPRIELKSLNQIIR